SQDVCGARVSSVQTTHSYGHAVGRHPRVSASRRNAQHPRRSRLRWFRPCPGSPAALLLWRGGVRSMVSTLPPEPAARETERGARVEWVLTLRPSPETG